ncbi:hypothetical protein LCGC14_0412200 [marine sediment metagenome]|uniref:Uncharacterized protein n=1 Tax=marine sediment metagenome TaxID=412755 RepID=A0A0F9SZA4_9ZZZZ
MTGTSPEPLGHYRLISDEDFTALVKLLSDLRRYAPTRNLDHTRVNDALAILRRLTSQPVGGES